MPAAVTTDELALLVDGPDSPFIFDVRASEQFDRWRIEGKAELDVMNVPYWTVLTDTDEYASQMPERPVVVVCAHGGSSGMIAEMMGLPNVANLEGGMKAWARTLVPRALWDDGDHFVVQFDRVAKGCLSYAVGTRGGPMAVIDPAVDPAIYLDFAGQNQCTITDTFDTHLHADHVSVGSALADAVGATYRIAEGDAVGAEFAYAPLIDGEEFHFGDVTVVVRSVATPGHTPGSTSLEVAGRFLMTGDAVFVSGVGRPDLGGETEPWARDLFRTIHERLAPLDPELEVCPAHYTSRSESIDDGTLRRPLGDLLTNDPVVSIAEEEAFVEHVVTHLGEPPAVYSTIRLVNLGRETVDADAIEELEVGRNECALSDG